ncbi:MAG: methionine--tRNA ligase [Oscillospiraceae bacterium]|nr:methionine--tRNA ligase [Oscillospiraceae bacterium]
MKEKFYITTAIAYTSKTPHIGNVYEVVMADAIARYKREKGYDVFYLTGTDEHGQKIEECAIESGVKPKEYVDKISSEIKDIWNLMNSSHDKFIRTTDKYHMETVQKIFRKLYDKGDIYKGEYTGLYCTPCESFWTENQLEEEKCPDCQRDVRQTKEEAYFFRMSKYQDRLLKHIEENKDFIKPESRKREMINNFLKPGLQDLCVSRTSFKWGIPVDFDTDHVIYVWIDALSNYITGLGFDVDLKNHGDLYKKYWEADLHVIGKDILRFHTIYWPIMLMALEVPLPKQILGHPWLLSGEDKMSKSKGNVLYANDLVDIFGVDGTRYYLLSQVPYANDGVITYENMINVYNSDLANTIGNLVNRTIAMIHKYFDGIIKMRDEKYLEDIDKDLENFIERSKDNYETYMDRYEIANGVSEIINIARRCNKYIDETTPWILGNDLEKKERLNIVLYSLLEGIRYIGETLKPIIPETAKKIFNQINLPCKEEWFIKPFGEMEYKEKLSTGKPLFERIDAKEFLEKEKEKLNIKEDKKLNIIEGLMINIEDFSKVELRVGKVIEALKIEKSDKLLLLKVDIGGKILDIVSGILKFYTTDCLKDKKVIVVSNLKPAKLRGMISQGMILAVDINKDSVKVLFLDDDIPEGTKIR